MKRDELQAKFSQTVGVEKAEAIVAEAAAELSLEETDAYSSDEIRELCEVIQHGHDGYVSDVANEIRVHEQAEARFETLLQNIPDPAVVVDFDGEEPILRTVNDAFEQTFGYGASAAGERLADLIVPEDGQAAANVWFTSGQHDEREVRRVCADDTERMFLFRAALANRAGGAVEGYGIYTDITERKRRERQLEHQNEQLERFASVVSHDLRNPLTVADGNLTLAQDRATDEQLRGHLSSIESAHDQMESLIEDLLSLARQGRSVGETTPVDLRRVCQEAWTHVQTDEADLSVELEGMRIGADEQRVSELLQNLFRNAVEHAGEAVTVRVGLLEDGDGFYVEDDGSGIPAAEQETVFEYGYTMDEDGTGIGLAIVESIAEAHGWTVSVTDGEDGGARFEFAGVSFA